MASGFEAEHIVAEPDGALPNVRFEEASDRSSRSLRFLRQFDEEGVARSEPLVEYVGSEKVRLGTLAKVLLKPRRLKIITFDETTPKSVHGPGEIIVTFQTTAAELRLIRKALRRVFRGTGLFIDDSVRGFGLLGAIVFGPPTPTSEMLVVPTYATIIGGIVGGCFAGSDGELSNIVWGVLAGIVFGFALGFVIGMEYYHLHKYKK